MNFVSLVRLASILPVLALPALGATRCVMATSTPGCVTHIFDAVNAASAGDIINVGPGTYAEPVVITMPLSLVGNGATIDATGMPRGIAVLGTLGSTLSGVHVSGFTVQNANLEGIFVENATDVSVANNTVMNNNKALVNGNCTMLPADEPGEAQDCGEGIHLQAVDHSIVTNNNVQNNSGGILISDDTGASHHNLVSYNTVIGNHFACGITMASHVPAATTGAAQPFGVFQNTVFANRSKDNGVAGSGGAGVGIFASVPGAKSYGNNVVDNYLSENGHPGVSIHAHAPGQSVNDNMIVGNTIVNNGADTADAATPGPTGINIYSVVPSGGNIVSGNQIQSEAYDVVTNIPALVQVQFNSLLGTGVGIYNQGGVPDDGTGNWFGCPSGPPMLYSCSSVLGPVQYAPSLPAPPPPPSPSY